MAFAELWLPIFGAGICIAWAIGAWYGGSKILSIWLAFGGAVCLLLLAALQLQHAIEKSEITHGKTTDSTIKQLRAYLGIDFAAVLLNSPSPGNITAWIRIKNSGATPAYKARGWQKFLRGATGQAPFGRVGEFENEAILGPGGAFNLSSTLTITPEQLQAIKDRTISLYVWGRVEYVDEFTEPRYFSFKSIMSGTVETVMVDGVRAEGWGLRPIQNGFSAN